MARLINSKWEQIQPGTSSSDGVNFSQLDARLLAAQKRQAYWLGTVNSGVVVPLVNGNTVIDSTDASPPVFYPAIVQIGQVAAGSVTIGLATVTIGTNSPAFNNIASFTGVQIGALGQGMAFNALVSSAIIPIAASSNITVRVSGLLITTGATLQVNILGAYRSS